MWHIDCSSRDAWKKLEEKLLTELGEFAWTSPGNEQSQIIRLESGNSNIQIAHDGVSNDMFNIALRVDELLPGVVEWSIQSTGTTPAMEGRINRCDLLQSPMRVLHQHQKGQSPRSHMWAVISPVLSSDKPCRYRPFRNEKYNLTGVSPVRLMDTRIDTPSMTPRLLYDRNVKMADGTSTNMQLELISPKYCGSDDIKLFNRWQNLPRVAKFWDTEGTLEDHTKYIRRNCTIEPFSLRIFGILKDTKFLYSEIYWMSESRTAPHMDDVRDFDRGFHILVGDDSFRGPHNVEIWLTSICHYIFLDDNRTDRVFLEPNTLNERMKNVLRRSGFTFLKTFDVPHKNASLFVLNRKTFFSRIARISEECDN